MIALFIYPLPLLKYVQTSIWPKETRAKAEHLAEGIQPYIQTEESTCQGIYFLQHYLTVRWKAPLFWSHPRGKSEMESPSSWIILQSYQDLESEQKKLLVLQWGYQMSPV